MAGSNAIDQPGAPCDPPPVTASRESASPPLAPAGGVSYFTGTSSEPEPAALYVDGFNLYHAIDALQQPHLKWLDLWALGERIIPRKTQKLVKVTYCSAKKTDKPHKEKRHQEYINALKSRGVKVLLGRFLQEDRTTCNHCGNFWHAQREKETDINLALSLYDDAYCGLFKHAYLISADSDQAATARFLKMRFPSLTLTSVAPPNMVHSKAIAAYADGKLSLSEAAIEACLFDGAKVDIVTGSRTLIYRRPSEYAPPAGWVQPALRQKR